MLLCFLQYFFFFQAEDGIRDLTVTGVQTCALPIAADGPATRISTPSVANASLRSAKRSSADAGLGDGTAAVREASAAAASGATRAVVASSGADRAGANAPSTNT